MIKYKNLFFPILMILLATLTFVKYNNIKIFKEESQEYSFVLSIDSNKLNSIKADLQNMTYQIVENEPTADGRYKLTFRCPPDRIKFFKEYLKQFNNNEIEEDKQ